MPGGRHKEVIIKPGVEVSAVMRELAIQLIFGIEAAVRNDRFQSA
jgi:hypothetical protein